VRVANELDLAVGLSAEENGLGSRKSERDRRQITRANVVIAKTVQVKTTLYHLTYHRRASAFVDFLGGVIVYL